MLPLKIIGLVPVRNEAHIIEQCLRALAYYTDVIVVLDDASEDDTIDKIKAVAVECRVASILCKKEWYRDEPKDKNFLLKEGRRLGGTHFIVIDADEIFTPNLKENNLLRNTILQLNQGDRLFLNWIPLWRSIDQYRFDNTHYTKYSLKEFVFCDDGKCFYSSEFIHTPRVPQNLSGQRYRIPNPSDRYEYGVLHFQFVHWENSLIKQAWYRCLEKIRLPQKSVLEINQCYAVTKDETNIKLNKSPENWFAYPSFDKGVYEQPTLYKEQVLKWFKEYGKDYFTDLDIWDIRWE